MQAGEQAFVNGAAYTLQKLLGKGKGGYSWLAERGGGLFVLKQIHHEPCSYYQFGDKLAAERADYARLAKTGIRLPRLLAVDEAAERLVKEYIDGPTVMELVCRDALPPWAAQQARGMAAALREHGLNIDWFPTNFIVQDGALWYIDFECNPYSEQWNFENWGVRYWARTPELEAWQKQQAGG